MASCWQRVRRIILVLAMTKDKLLVKVATNGYMLQDPAAAS